MVIGLLPDATTIDTLLNNLAEADFNPADISVVMKDVVQRAQVAGDVGPLKGAAVSQLADRLTHAGLAKNEAGHYVDAVRAGKILVAIDTSDATEAAAREMLLDHAAQQVKGWH